MTDKQRKFADEYLIDCNATRAYKVAYPSVKKDEVARTNSSRLLTNANVKSYIEQKLEEISSGKTADAKEVMEYLTSVMRREHKECIVVTLTNKVEKWVADEDTGKLKKQTVTEESPSVVEIPAKLSDANKAAELLGKRYALFTDKTQIEGAVPVVIAGEDDLEE